MARAYLSPEQMVYISQQLMRSRVAYLPGLVTSRRFEKDRFGAIELQRGIGIQAALDSFKHSKLGTILHKNFSHS